MSDNITRGAAKAADAAGVSEKQVRSILDLADEERVGVKHVSKALAKAGAQDHTSLAQEAIRFPVALFEIPHPTVKGETIPGRRALIRTDNNAVLNVVSERYKLVPHADMLEPVAQAIKELGIDVKEERLSQSMGGAYIRYEWILDTEDTVAKGDDVRWKIVGRNSYNYESRFDLGLEADRLVCLNGMRLPIFVESVGGKHTTHLDVDGALVQLENLIGQENLAVAEWKRWASKKVTRDRFEGALAKYPEMGKRVIEIVGDRFAAGPGNVWQAYNAITWYASNELVTRTDRETIVQDQLGRRAVEIARILA